MKLSIVSTLYQSAPYVVEFHKRASAVATGLVNEDYEIILVNDGSPDESLDEAVNLAKIDTRVTVVDLSRNFGHHQAMFAGLTYARGERVFLIDSDLEEEPEWLIEFVATLEKEDVDVVYGVQQTRKGGWFERWSGNFYYSIVNSLSEIEHPRNVVTSRLMSRRYVDALLQFGEREMVISGLWVLAGFKQRPQLVSKGHHSPTAYGLATKVNHAVNAITSFSEAPLRLIFGVGISIFGVSLLISIYLIFQRLLSGSSLEGWTSVMVSVWLLGGLIISFVGVIGIYLSKIFVETKNRPAFIVRQVHGQSR
jgi:putative glycosyltransferase